MSDTPPDLRLADRRRADVAWALTLLGLLGLTAPAVALAGLGVFGATVVGGLPLVGAVLLAVTIGIALGVRYEWWFLRGALEWPRTQLVDIGRITAAIVGGTITTFGLAVELGLSPIVAAGAVGVVAAIATPDDAVPVYCGAFVGMTSPVLFGTYWVGIVAGLCASAVYLIAQPVFHGIGGKLGTTAFVGVVITVVATAGSFEGGPLPAIETAGLAIGYGVVGAALTFAIHHRTAASPVFASGIVGVVGGLGIPVIHDGAWILAAVVFSASFVGMSADRRIPDERWVALAGAIAGLLVVYTTPYLGGSGGKLGTIAFASALAVHGLLVTAHVVRLRRRVREFPIRDTT